MSLLLRHESLDPVITQNGAVLVHVSTNTQSSIQRFTACKNKMQRFTLLFLSAQSCHHIHHHQDLLLCVLVSVQTETAGSVPEQSTQCTDSHCRRTGLPPSDV